MLTLEEAWKSVGVVKGTDYSGYYEASTLGNIRSVDRYIEDKRGRCRKWDGDTLSQYKNKRTGYMTV